MASYKDKKFEDFSLDPSEIFGSMHVCDTKWHSVEFKNTAGSMSIEFNGHLKRGPTLTKEFRNTEFIGNLFVGGVEDALLSDSSHLLKYFEEDGRSFGGCIREIQLNDIELSLTKDVKAAYNVDLDGCPVDYKSLSPMEISGSEENSGSGSGAQIPPHVLNVDELDGTSNFATCTDHILQVAYEGIAMSFTDTNLTSFTQYLYRITSSNAGGHALSTWKVMRAGEGLPESVSSPFNARHVNGETVEVQWRRPRYSNGVICNYTLVAVAYELQDVDGKFSITY